MCIQQRWITNKYTGHKFLVKCGHCEACLQEKANKRTNRIRYELSDGRIALFVTLTYDRFSCPYIKLSDVAQKPSELNIYREIQARYDYRSDSYTYYKQSVVLDTIYNPDYYYLFKDNVDGTQSINLKTLKHRKHNVGVCYFPDLQNFHKRLNINLRRKYNYHGKYKFFNCSEYGESSKRPHFHVLLFIDKDAESLFRKVILEAWPFANQNITKRGIERAKNAASYVSSYVNCGSYFSKFLQDNFRPKHSFSKGLGMGLSSFQLDEILSKIDRGNLCFTTVKNSGNGIVYTDIPIPKYVINRFFPLFKGYSRITRSSLHDVLLYPKGLYRYSEIEYSEDDVHKIHIRIFNAYHNYFRDRMDFSSYLLLYDRAWSAYRSTCYRHFMEDDTVSTYEKYDNLFECYLDEPYKVTPSFELPDKLIVDPNLFKSNLRKHRNMVSLFHKKLKTKTVNNISMSNLNYHF